MCHMLKDLLSAGKKQDALGEGGLFAGDVDGVFEFDVAGAAKSAERTKPGAETGGLQAKKGKLKGALEVDPDHAGQSEEAWACGQPLAGGQIEERFQTGAEG